jgi:hypothetical protein
MKRETRQLSIDEMISNFEKEFKELNSTKIDDRIKFIKALNADLDRWQSVRERYSRSYSKAISDLAKFTDDWKRACRGYDIFEFPVCRVGLLSKIIHKKEVIYSIKKPMDDIDEFIEYVNRHEGLQTAMESIFNSL